jgi:uncharacterized membrane protein
VAARFAPQTTPGSAEVKRVRRTVTTHGIVSFVSNAALVALTVNIAASAVQAGDEAAAALHDRPA